MGSKLRIKELPPFQQLLGAGDIGKIRARFAGKNRIPGKAEYLGALDLGIPVSPFDEPDHDAPAMTLSQAMQPVDNSTRPKMIGLDHHTKSVPAHKRGIRH